MALTAGTRLGGYTILEAIGAGGMGEVYRARDGKLDRDVAIKVLPSHLAIDPDARARFEREAKAVASLSHPNILAIYDFGIHDGIAYAVLELLHGETLRQRLVREPVAPLRKAIDVGAQIAHGLAAAHAHGIAHRDLKPENVFLCADGRVKLLDFGLARQMAAPANDQADSPTTLQHTEPGTVLGTVGYMSPEQVRGQPATERSDIFSFGCVLFEMATGRRAFHGETAAETMTAILRTEPLDVPGEGTAVPSALEPVVRHCLEKRPEDRFHSAKDLAFALQIGTGTPPSGRDVAPAQHARPRRGEWRWAAAGGAAGAVLALVASQLLAGRSQDAAGSAAHPVSFQQVTDAPGVESTPSLSPDGKSVVFASDAAGNTDLYLMRIGGRTPTLLTADSKVDDYQPAWSPDGEHIAFRSEREGGGIFIMTSTGESVRRLTDTGYSPSWSPDAREIVFSAGTFVSPTDRGATAFGLWAVDVKTGARRTIADRHEGLQPSWSPHGSRIAAWGLRGTTGQRDIWTYAADGSDAQREPVTVTDDTALDWSPVWSPDGGYLYFSSNRGGTMNLWRVAIDERSGKVTGELEPLTTPSIWSGAFSFSRDGTKVAYASLDWRSTMFRVPFDAAREALAGPPMPILKSTRPIRDHEISPDGEWVAFMETGSQEDLFVARTDGSQYRRLTDDTFRDRAPAWSPDGRKIAFYSDRSGSYELWTIHPDGSGQTRLTDFKGGVNFPIWAPDGARLAFSGVNAGGWFIVPADASLIAKPAPELPIAPGLDFWPFSWSSDGARIAGGVRRGDGTLESIRVYSVASKRFERVPATFDAVWGIPLWLADGRRLLVRDAAGLWIVHPDTGAKRSLLPLRGYSVGRSAGISRDNRWITYTETGTDGDVWIATLKK